MLESLLSPQTKKMLNTAAGHELYASNLYKHLANCMQKMGLFGSQKYFLSESSDELVHYQKIADFMNDRLDQVVVSEVPKMEDKPTSLFDTFKLAFDTEVDLGTFYTESYKKCDDEVVKQFLLQFIEIQRVSIGEYADKLATLKFIGDNKAGQLTFDLEQGE